MSKRHVYDECNPFTVELKRKRESETQQNDRINKFFKRTAEMDAYSRHKLMINNYLLYRPGAPANFQRDTTLDRNDYDIIRENHKFIRDESEKDESTWEAKLARKYYDKLFKEYCIADLTYYAKNKIALRWRVEKEVISGKGQFECGNKHCQRRDNLSSWEVNFNYVEQGERKNALVKVRLCDECSAKLNFHSKKRLIKKEEKFAKKPTKKGKREKKHRRSSEKKRDRDSSTSSSSSSSSADDDEDRPGTSKNVEKETLGKDVKVEGAEEEEEQDESMITTKVKSAEEFWKNRKPIVEVEKTMDEKVNDFLDTMLL